ncbi:hypothetical protein T03_16664 [Trichinella britovi]|uniref:Uncharacterized protein n=1 Tax=Trichinella britovi TaxID=45882 RepID=A0A0V1D191_TRIBR|nr:hypothetical protein T03_16664 [Trichinella britovi]
MTDLQSFTQILKCHEAKAHSTKKAERNVNSKSEYGNGVSKYRVLLTKQCYSKLDTKLDEDSMPINF